MLAQLLHRNSRARNPKRDSSQEPRIVADARSSQDLLDFPFINASFPILHIPCALDEFDFLIRNAEITMPATSFRHRILVREMFCQSSAQAALGSDEVDDLLDAMHVAFFSGFDLRIEGRDDVILG